MLDLEITDGITAIDKSYMTKYTNKILNTIFPIGSTYITQTNTNPNNILGIGTWERIKGKVLVGLDEDDEAFNSLGKEGGEKTHTQTIEELARHNHSFNKEGVVAFRSGGGNDANQAGGTRSYDFIGINSTGNSKPMNILQPYRVVGYMWIRAK